VITFLPDPEIQKAQAERKRLEPKNPFSFLWNEFFNRRKFRLTPEEVRELERAEATVQPWRDALGHLWKIAREPDENLWTHIGELKQNPGPETIRAFLLSRYVSPAFSVQTEKALDELQGEATKRLGEAVVPLVRKHLEKIHDALVGEYREQEASDKKSMARLDGIASGGESQSCIALRVQTERIQELLQNGDLTNWREALGAFLP